MVKTLCNKNRELVTFEFERGMATKIIKTLDENLDFLPLELYNHVEPKSINNWISKRQIPTNREGINVFQEMKIKPNMGGFFSLSDQYWLKSNDKESWKNGNFFTNKYSREYGKLFFTPWCVNKSALSRPSPDLTTNGVLKKTWVQDANKISYLYKAGSEKMRQAPTSEVLASLMLKKLNVIDFVQYNLDIYGLCFCSKCRNFINECTEFVPARHIYIQYPRTQKETIVEHMIKACEPFGIADVEKNMLLMIGVDTLIGNTDRHLNNFGFIRNVETGKFEGFAPLFDFGLAYTGNNDTGAKKSLFSDREIKAGLKQVAASINVSDVNVKDMKEVVHMFPFFDNAERDIINKKILKTKERLEKEITR